jgi:glutathione S-transferase
MMLRYKGIEHEIFDIPPGAQRVVLRLRGFRGGTVPALKLDGRKLQGSRQISRALEELKPEPHLFPADPAQRNAVVEAERWGEAEFQPVPRNVFRWSAARDNELRKSLAQTTGLPAPALAARLSKPVGWYFARIVSGTSEESIRNDLARLPAQLDHVDELVGECVIGNEQPNAADFQIATTIRVLLNFPPLRPMIEGRPAEDLAMRIIPRFGDQVPLRLPPEWVPGATVSA